MRGGGAFQPQLPNKQDLPSAGRTGKGKETGGQDSQGKAGGRGNAGDGIRELLPAWVMEASGRDGERCGEGVKPEQKHFRLCSQEAELGAKAQGARCAAQGEWHGLCMKAGGGDLGDREARREASSGNTGAEGGCGRVTCQDRRGSWGSSCSPWHGCTHNPPCLGGGKTWARQRGQSPMSRSPTTPCQAGLDPAYKEC